MAELWYKNDSMRHILCATILFVSVNQALAGVTEVVVTTDCGADVDSQWAIAHLVLLDQIRVAGIVGNFAPEPHGIHGADTAKCAREVLEKVGRPQAAPVFAGADGPLPDAVTARPNAGVEFLIERSRAHSRQDRLNIVALGPATDIASALLADPTIADRAEVTALAFDAYPAGGDGWNVRNDVSVEARARFKSPGNGRLRSLGAQSAEPVQNRGARDDGSFGAGRTLPRRASLGFSGYLW